MIKKQWRSTRIVSKSVLLLLLLVLLGLFFCPRINLATADLGRHIKNGGISLLNHALIDTNYYSYTEPDYKVINHHWGSGIVFYFIWLWAGFKGLAIFFAIIFLITFLLFFFLAAALSNFSWAYIFAVLSVPVVIARTEIRPEIFSYLLLGIFLNILYFYHAGKIRNYWLGVLFLLQVLWVNLHIFFILGPILVVIFMADAWFNFKEKYLRTYIVLFIALALACLINPWGIEGALVPFTIFKQYGYMLAENQSVIFMQKRFLQQPIYWHFEFIFFFMMVGLGLNIKKIRQEKFIWIILIMGLFSALAWKAIRGLSLYGLVFIPLTAFFYHNWCKDKTAQWINILKRGILIVSCVIVVWGLVGRGNHYSPYKMLQLPITMPEIKNEKFWLAYVLKHPNELIGLMPAVNKSADFFKEKNLEGPIFNNYDLGGYLIYHLFPQEKVFVDNRPEAYSVSFFKNIYIPMQENEAIWQQMLERYQFNAIYFYWHDMTPWGQKFLIERINDPTWAPIFADSYNIIFIKRNQENQAIINHYELPKSMFKTTSNKGGG